MYPFNEEKLGALMAGQQIDMVLVCSRHNMRYLTGYFYHFYENFTRIGVSQYMPLLGLPAKGMRRQLLRRRRRRAGPDER